MVLSWFNFNLILLFSKGSKNQQGVLINWSGLELDIAYFKGRKQFKGRETPIFLFFRGAAPVSGTSGVVPDRLGSVRLEPVPSRTPLFVFGCPVPLKRE